MLSPSSEVWKNLTYTPRHRVFYALLPLAALHSFACYAPALTITQPGLYTLGEDITFSPGAADSIISIQSSDVTLDLGGRSVIQGNATASVNGISISAGLQRITIKNGAIRGVTGRGVFVDCNTQVNNLTISGILFDTCQSRGISFEGAAIVAACFITNCSFIDCLLPAAGDSILFLRGVGCVVKDITIETISFGMTGAKTIINLDLMAYGLFENISIRAITTIGALTILGSFAGANRSNIFKNIYSFECASSTSTFTCINLASGGSSSSMFINCWAQSQLNSGGNIIFCSANGISNPNLYLSCGVLGLPATVAGSQFTGFSFTNCSNQTLIDCLIERGAAAGDCSAYLFSGCTACQIIRCYAFNNSSGAANSVAGFGLDSTCTKCVLRDCIAANNTGGIVARGYFISGTEGIYDGNAAYQNNATVSVGYTQGGLTNTYLRNVALRNGTTGANQFAAFGVNQQQVFSLAASNSLTVPWTNVGLV